MSALSNLDSPTLKLFYLLKEEVELRELLVPSGVFHCGSYPLVLAPPAGASRTEDDDSVAGLKIKPGPLQSAVAIALVSLAIAGCSSSSTGEQVSSLSDMEDTIRGDFEQQKNVLVDDIGCEESTDADHFRCRVSYETAEGVKLSATVNVACGPDRCVWREA